MAAMGAARRALLTFRSSSPRHFTGFSTSLTSSLALAFACCGKLPLSIVRLPVELGCAQSLMPLHSITASALLTSMLSLKPGNWAWLSEGFATPLWQD